ncbi:Doublecortin domain-containing protein [Aphelenchoides fujianensis]|nr:Doublecortin domain-containing protein [Aphelenchoides fujianensis]
MSSDTAGSPKKTKKRTKSKGGNSRSPSKAPPAQRAAGTHPTTTKPEVVLNMKHSHDINTFLDAISERVGLISGVKRLYTLNGSLVRSTQQLENNHEYVASSGGFMPLDYGAAYRRNQAAFVGRNANRGGGPREDSALSIASKRSNSTRMSKSNTELRSTSRDLTVNSLNGSSAKSSTTTGSTLNGTLGRSRSLAAAVANKKRADAKTTGTGEEEGEFPGELNGLKGEAEEEEEGGRRAEGSERKGGVVGTETESQEDRNLPTKSENPRSSTPSPAARSPPAVVVQESRDSRPSTRAESRFSTNRPPSRRSQRTASPSKEEERRTSTVESRRRSSAAAHEAARRDSPPDDREHASDHERETERESRHSDERHSDGHRTDGSDHDEHRRGSRSEHEQHHEEEHDRPDTPPTHRTDRSHQNDEGRENAEITSIRPTTMSTTESTATTRTSGTRTPELTAAFPTSRTTRRTAGRGRQSTSQPRRTRQPED